MISSKSLRGLLAVNVCLHSIVTFYCYFKPFYITSVLHNFLCFSSFSSFISGDLYLCDVWENIQTTDNSKSLCLKIPWTLCMPETSVDASGELSSGLSIACRYSYHGVLSSQMALCFILQKKKKSLLYINHFILSQNILQLYSCLLQHLHRKYHNTKIR